jgi:deoxycytidylate deaminase
MVSHRYNTFVDLAIAINNRRTDFVIRNRVVAIFFAGRKPVVIAMNQRKTHPAIKRYGYSRFTCTIHAELGGVIALTNSGTVADSVLIVRGDGSYASAPCKYCAAILKGHGITKVFYPEGD